MKKLFLCAGTLMSCIISLHAQVENKAVSTNFNFKGTTIDSYVEDPVCAITVPETGNYLVIVEAEALVPTAQTNGCLSSYWNGGYMNLYNKTTKIGYPPGVGAYKWYMNTSSNGCKGGQIIPTGPSHSYILKLTAGNVLTVRGKSGKVGTQNLEPWSFSGKVQLIRLN